jgi:hypothetical protein
MQNTILPANEFNQQVLDFHTHAAKQGFYDDYPTAESRNCSEFRLKAANLIHGEIYEAYEAFRNGKIDAEQSTLRSLLYLHQKQGLNAFAAEYKNRVKGTVAEELADAYIRTCDTIGAMQIRSFEKTDIEKCQHYVSNYKDGFLGIHWLFTFAMQTFDIGMGNDIFGKIDIITWFLAPIHALANYFKIDLHLHVELKHLYNTTRSYKHGKDF